MNNFYKSLALIVFVTLSACQKSVDTSAADPVWDRAVCEQCKMHVSDRHFSAQAVNPQNGQRVYFDDVGCALKWLQNPHAPDWAQNAIVYVTAQNSGKWISLKDAHFAGEFMTPMSSGIAAFERAEDVPAGKTRLTRPEAEKLVQSRGHRH